ncbi:MAG: anaerobic ribonucleoside-triphosphate reductase [Leptospirales bacterium]|nr:anaerobic ribonucleoside-triphosphate reductase [Leptospirales bacterium]
MKIVTEVYSRVSGYFRPVNQWNKGKQSEFSQRRSLRIDKLKGDDNEYKTNIDRETKL